MVRDWLREKDGNSRGYRPHPERWQVSDEGQVLGRCVGSEGDLLINSESVELSKEEESTFDDLFKNRRSRKNGYKTRDYVDRKRRNVAVAILQILQPHRTSYMTSCARNHTLGPTESRGRASGYAGTQEAKLGEEEEMRWRELLAVPSRRWATNEQTRSKQKARKLILTAGSSADMGRAAISKGLLSLEEEDVSTGVLGRSIDLPAPKAHVPSEEARRPSGRRDRLAATARVPALEVCLPSEQVLFEDAPSEQGPLGQVPFKVPSEEAPCNNPPKAKTAE
ncbi:hypothetical protein AXG93_3671s1110 [Marchantia polymorpha subsp. ruderalis]|uniref:Uncharacterized protein n=1 Tax=Marchantia polymorpha subsp. ruderalis TaxID=1480154 RepID=A0A176WJ62_MARPO|nr:hypothetical protein AXG93_3671s1110 [Marchantia polymorpha subsp. ruderalis]